MELRDVYLRTCLANYSFTVLLAVWTRFKWHIPPLQVAAHSSAW